jgi:hypothetical protein
MEDEELDDASSKKADSSAALRTDKRMDEQLQKQIRGFFATLRMTTLRGWFIGRVRGWLIGREEP